MKTIHDNILKIHFEKLNNKAMKNKHKKLTVKTSFEKRESEWRGFEFQKVLNSVLKNQEGLAVDNEDLRKNFENYKSELFGGNTIKRSQFNIYHKTMENLTFKDFISKINQIKDKEASEMGKNERDTIKIIYFLIKVAREKEDKQGS